ncbi:hypothetical protein Tco_0357784, partial [Tanacetum coccineum]
NATYSASAEDIAVVQFCFFDIQLTSLSFKQPQQEYGSVFRQRRSVQEFEEWKFL